MRQRLHWIGWLVLWASAVALFLAGFLKFLDLYEFWRSLHGWTLLAGPLRTLAAYAVPSCELALGSVFIAGLKRKPGRWSLLFCVGILTAGYGLQWLVNQPPDCRCFGKIAAFERFQGDAAAHLSALVVWFLALLGACVLTTRSVSRGKGGTQRRGCPHPARGFTIVELLVVIAVVALLLAIVLPLLAGARRKARETKAIANMQSHAQVVGVYLAEFTDRFPCVTDPSKDISELPIGEHGTLDVPYFLASQAWNLALGPRYYSGADDQSFYSPFATDRSYGFSSYMLACTLLADPAYWNRATRTGRSQFRGTKASEVAFPTKKSVLVAELSVAGSWVRTDDDPESGVFRALGFADGHTARATLVGITEQYYNGDGVGDFSAHNWPFAPGLHGLDGVRGLDIR